MAEVKLTWLLKQYTPYIAFEHKDQTLRATELKPKLDRFILKTFKTVGFARLFGEVGISGYKSDEEFIKKVRLPIESENGGTAFDYKARIAPIGENTLGISEIHPLYFGNMRTMDEEDKKKTSFYPDGIRLEIVCFHPDLLKIIKNIIESFFLFTNFGTRQSKGFGSFYPFLGDEKNLDIKNAVPDKSELMKKISRYQELPYYYTTYGTKVLSERLNKIIKRQKQHRPLDQYDVIMDDVASLYALMKSGVNHGRAYYRAYIYKYMHELGIGNEKAWMKKNKIAPIVQRKGNELKHEHLQYADEKDYQYVRAMLGLSDHLSYITELENDKPKRGAKRRSIKIAECAVKKESGSEKNKSPLIERYASPILFKIIDNILFIIPQEVDKRLFSRSFEFSYENDSKKIIAKRINTPESFDIIDFMRQFKDYIESPKMDYFSKKGIDFHMTEVTKNV